MHRAPHHWRFHPAAWLLYRGGLKGGAAIATGMPLVVSGLAGLALVVLAA